MASHTIDAAADAASTLLDRSVTAPRLALIYRSGETLAYNPAINSWHRLDAQSAAVLRWLRAGRPTQALQAYFEERFSCTDVTARQRLAEIVRWCLLRSLLYLDRAPATPSPADIAAASPDGRRLATVYWICTQACNLRCTYCYQEATVARPAELTTVEGKDLIEQAWQAGATTFIFTGGEPFSRPDLLDLAQHAKSLGLATNVVTNGQYITRKNIRQVARTFDAVSISLDHGLPEHHDRSRGAKSWERALRAIDLLLRYHVRVDVNSVLARYGLADVAALLRLVRERGLGEHRITPQFPMGRGIGFRDDELRPHELLGLSDHLRQSAALAQVTIGAAPSHPPAAQRLEGEYTGKKALRNHCGAGLSEVSVDPEGWVYPCKLLQYEAFRGSNVRDKRLADIYEVEPALRRTRAATTDALDTCKTCIVRQHCGGGCRGIQFSLTGSYASSDPLMCAYIRRSFESQAWASTGTVPPGRRTDYRQGRVDGATRRVIPIAANVGAPSHG